MKRDRSTGSGTARFFTLIWQPGGAAPTNALDKTADFNAGVGVYRSLTLIGKDRAS
jgi:hypothetical protein